MTENEIMFALDDVAKHGFKLCGLAFGLIKHKNAEIKRIKSKVETELKYYLEINEENGVVFIPKFAVEKILKEMEK